MTRNIARNSYENLVNNYINHRDRVGKNLLKMAEIIVEAKNNLTAEEYHRFLNDDRINLKRIQASKFIAIYESAKKDSRLTQFFNKEGVEKSYLTTLIEDEETRNQFIEVLATDKMSVRQAKQATLYINTECKSIEEAVRLAKEVKPKLESTVSMGFVSIAEFKNLEALYNKILSEKLELEERLREVSSRDVESLHILPSAGVEFFSTPEKTDLPELTFNAEERSIVVNGWKLPFPPEAFLENKSLEILKLIAINYANNNHKLDLK